VSGANGVNGIATRAPAPAAGMTLPWSEDAEKTVLGSLLMDPAAKSRVFPLLTTEDFYHPAHGAIYDAMVGLDSDSKPIDAITVAEQMRASDSLHRLRALGGEGYFAELTSAVITVENVAFHAKVIADAAMVRRIMEVAQELYRAGFKNDYGDAETYALQAVESMSAIARGRRSVMGSRPYGKVILEVVHEAEAGMERLSRGVPPVVIPTPYPELTELIIGWEPGTLNILAALPSVGKTALMMDFVECAAIAGYPCFVGSREMKETSVVRRRLAAAANVEHARIKRSTLDNGELGRIYQAAGWLSELPIEITRPFYSFAQFESALRQWHARNVEPGQPWFGTLDYLQLVTPTELPGRDTRNRSEKVGEMSHRLKSLGQELNGAMLVLSQLNRLAAKEEPSTHHLRESGDIEADGDLIMFIMREKGATEATLKIDKQRNGDLGRVPLIFDPTRVRFLDGSAGARLPPTRRDYHDTDRDE